MACKVIHFETCIVRTMYEGAGSPRHGSMLLFCCVLVLCQLLQTLHC